jgi:glycosyltransferase involved in cell wall biosynthesis
MIADALPNMMTVEFGIGYGGTFAKYRVWESYAWMHTCYGAAAGNPHAADGQWFDAVIPNYFEPEKFPFRADKDDYYLYIGRLIERKGCSIAADVCQKLGKRLVVAGHGERLSYGEHVGVVGPEERGRLMAGAIATFVPTIYVEPFGGVAVEAMLCGTPVISTDWGAMTETVVNGVTGFRCRTLAEFMRAAEDVKALDPAAIRKHAIERYSLDAIAPQYDAYFRRLLTLWGDGWYAAA